ncbi:MAG TPA: LacI family transcriptional regulator [Firmicutes bacterium]|nr:LacI family transcriptional regulator [Bacillota bacterium]
MITIYDIAKKAGVSPTTVSRVINNYEDVSAKTRKKVLETIEEMNYIPSPSARSLSTKKSYLVGILFSEALGIGIEHPFFSGVIEHFKRRMEFEGYDTMFVATHLGNKEMSYLKHCQYRQLDGVFVVTGNLYEDKLHELLNSDIKCVTTDLIYKSTPRVSSDDYDGAAKVVSYFVDQGSHDIGIISGPLYVSSALTRYNGFVETYEKLVGNFDQRFFIESADFDVNAGYEAAKLLVERFGRFNIPSCLFIGGDTIAIGVMKYLKEIGLQIPKDVKIIGYDDIEVAKQVSPALSTVAQNRQAIGCGVAETLISLIEGKEAEAEKVIDVELVLRETT